MTPVIPVAAARLLALLSLGLLLMTCKSQEDMLPSATQTGQNTFGCLIDGKSYVPNGGPGFMPSKPVNGGFLVIYYPIRLGVYIRTYAKDKQRIEVYLNDYAIGKHFLNSDTQTKPSSLSPKSYGLYENDTTDFITSSKHSGWVNLTHADTLNGIVSGTFEFKAATTDGKTVSISNGRFDVNARTQ